MWLIVLNNRAGRGKARKLSTELISLLEKEKQVSGVVRKVKSELDGDIHIRLYIKDKELLTKNNEKYEDECLVLEIICAKKSIFSACKNYKNNILI